MSCVLQVLTGGLAELMEAGHVHWVWMVLACCIVKMVLSGAFVAGMIYTVECYPTLLTGTGFGICNAFTRAGGALTPLVGAVLIDDTTSFLTWSVFGVGCAFGALTSFLLPFETLGRDADAVERARLKQVLTEATPLTAA